MKKGGGTSPKKILCDVEKAKYINTVLDSIFKIASDENISDCQRKLEDIKEIIKNSPNTRSISKIGEVIEGGKSKSKSKSKTKKKKRKRNKRRKTYKNKKMG